MRGRAGCVGEGGPSGVMIQATRHAPGDTDRADDRDVRCIRYRRRPEAVCAGQVRAGSASRRTTGSATPDRNRAHTPTHRPRRSLCRHLEYNPWSCWTRLAQEMSRELALLAPRRCDVCASHAPSLSSATGEPSGSTFFTARPVNIIQAARNVWRHVVKVIFAHHFGPFAQKLGHNGRHIARKNWHFTLKLITSV